MEKRVFFFHCFRNAITFLPLLLFVVMGQFRFKVSSFFASVLLLVQLAPGRGQFGGYSLQPFQEFSEETREIVDDGWSDYVVGLHTVLDENGEERQEERPKDWDCRHCTVKNAAIDKICALHRHLG